MPQFSDRVIASLREQARNDAAGNGFPRKDAVQESQ